MASKHALNVSLTAHLVGFVEGQVHSGRFSTASEVVRAGLRLLERDLMPPGPAAVRRDGFTRGAAVTSAGTEGPATAEGDT